MRARDELDDEECNCGGVNGEFGPLGNGEVDVVFGVGGGWKTC